MKITIKVIITISFILSNYRLAIKADSLMKISVEACPHNNFHDRPWIQVAIVETK